LLLDWNLKKAKERLRAATDHVFTGAFNISNSGSTRPKIDRVCDDYIQPVWIQRKNLANKLLNCKTLADAQTILQKLPGLGGSGFMAAQVVCDLKYTYVLETAKDWWTWCSPGPGSKRGMNRLHNREIDAAFSKEQWVKEIAELQKIVSKKFNLQICRKEMERFHAQDLQNCLCESDKYNRVLFGTGQSKRKYPGI
jgi:hypothetical protein